MTNLISPLHAAVFLIYIMSKIKQKVSTIRLYPRVKKKNPLVVVF